VSAVINNSRPVSAGLRARVEQAIAELEYRPSLVARALFTKRTRALALLVPSLANPFFAALLREVETTAYARDYSVFVGSTEGDPRKANAYGDRLLAMGVDGLLVSLSWDIVSSGVVASCLAHGVQVVGASGARITSAVSCFVGDDVLGGAQATKHLLELGHRRIAFLGSLHSEASRLRHAGVKQALAEAGQEADDKLFIPAQGYTEANAYQAMRRRINGNSPFSAVICFNDVMAIGAINALLDLSLAVPNDMSVIGFDDTLVAYARPKLTTVAYPTEEIGRSAAAHLIARVEGQILPPLVTRCATRLVVRESTRAFQATT
jgi:DNA-binding LacI/PurR family transcriptional regulator